MALQATPGGTVRVTITKSITRAAAAKTLERLFMSDPVASAPVDIRSANFKDKPKRRGGRIWTKRPNKLHIDLSKGTTATIKSTPQHVRDLSSVSEFVEVASA
ncbi:MAG TPA: hypothetical protein VF624_09510 [Tepidisphaeraceae bacterium]|jgi:hypothetical protein